MKNQKKVESRMTGYISECYVVYELARKGIKAQKMDSFMGHYDLITEFGVRVEVKCSRPTISWNGAKTHKSLIWMFNNQNKEYIFSNGSMRESRKIRDRDCDFFIFIGMDNDRNIKGVFIVPKSIVGKKQVLSEPVVRKRINSRTTLNLRDWEDRWDLLTSQKQRNTRPK